MEVDPAHQLAFALRSAPKLFACLLGSGVSRAAGVPTGWEVVLDLVRRHAAQLGEGDVARENPVAWYRGRYGREPDYAEVVERLAPTTDLQRSLLEPYFTVQDSVSGEQREHAPTAAHAAIARLVRRGYVRSVLTTNFDRLIETALRGEGVARVDAVSSAAEAESAPPFHASPCFVFKLHGDWRDTTLRNSRAQLAEYPASLARLLERVLDDHGLIVCGWSAQYDIALQEALARRKRRFPIYWIDPKASDATSARIRDLDAVLVPMTADNFFERLELAITALERYHPPEQLDADVLVLKAKRLIESKRDMALADLVEDATRALARWIEGTFKPTFSATAAEGKWRERADELLGACETASVPMARLLFTLARYGAGGDSVVRSFSALLKSAKTAAESQQTRRDSWWWLHGYPAVLAAYAYGVGCAFREDWRSAIVAARDAGSGDAERELRLPPWKQEYFALPVSTRKPGPPTGLYMGNRIADWLFPLASDWIPRRAQFDPAFDRFDVIFSMLSLRTFEAEWRPRCTVPYEANPAYRDTRTRASFEATYEDWFVYRIQRIDPYATVEDPLIEVLREHPFNATQIFERLRSWTKSAS